MDDATLIQDAAALARAGELSRQPDKAPGTVPGYTLSHCLGEGSYGAVWLAREENTGKRVAIKFYTHHRGLDWSLLNREVEKLAHLYTSRNIVRLLGVGWDAEPPYYLMEYLENGSLTSFLAEGQIPAHEAVRIAKAVLHALVHAHGSGILHCDLKPANILLDADFEPRICDFGQSRLSNEQSPALGTLFYMAPEQADLKAIPDARWDVYAVGALLYHMLCGEPPFRSEENERLIRTEKTLEGRLAVYRRIIRQSPRPDRHRKVSGVDRRLAEIVDRCLNVDPRRRYPNAQAVLDELELRERQRARRPLMFLGIVGPGILLLAMSIIVGNVMRKSIENTREAVIKGALDSDVHAARILAHGLKRDLEDRKLELANIAEGPIVRTAVTASAGITDLEVRRANFRQLLEAKAGKDKERSSFGRTQDVSWFVTDQGGVQIWREPYEEKTDLENYSFRDYYHGRHENYAKGQVPPDIKPIRAPHLSMAFRSQAHGQWIVAVTVPVWDEQHQEVIGVLGRTTLLAHLLDDYGEAVRGVKDRTGAANGPTTTTESNAALDGAAGPTADRFVALVQCLDGRLLAHRWMTPERMRDVPFDTFQRLSVEKKIADELRKMSGRAVQSEKPNGHNVLREANYRDPAGDPAVDPGGEYAGLWLAAFVQIDGTDWVAIVQERRDAALTPIAALQSSMATTAAGGLVMACALVGVLWYFVLRALSERRTMLRAGRGGPLRSSELTASVRPGETSTSTVRDSQR